MRLCNILGHIAVASETPCTAFFGSFLLFRKRLTFIMSVNKRVKERREERKFERFGEPCEQPCRLCMVPKKVKWTDVAPPREKRTLVLGLAYRSHRSFRDVASPLFIKEVPG